MQKTSVVGVMARKPPGSGRTVKPRERRKAASRGVKTGSWAMNFPGGARGSRSVDYNVRTQFSTGPGWAWEFGNGVGGRT